MDGITIALFFPQQFWSCFCNSGRWLCVGESDS
jgi:hypothetical protein